MPLRKGSYGFLVTRRTIGGRMAHIHRALRLLLVFCAALSAQLAHASFPATSSGTGFQFYTSGYGSTPPGVFATMPAACEAWRVLNGLGSVTTNASTMSCSAGFGAYTKQAFSAAIYTCPANSTLAGSSCTCNSGFNESGGTCVPPPSCPSAGTGAGDGRLTLSSSQRAALNASGGYYYWRDDDGCVVRTSMDVCTTGDNGATWNCVGKETYTGESYTGTPGDGSGAGAPSSTPSTTPPAGEENQPTACPTGQCPGTINGVNVCKPCGGISTTKDKVEEKQNPDGTEEKNETSSKTTCTGNTCTTESTTTTTNRDASGTVTGTSSTTTTSTEDKGDYCQRNPNEPQCDDTGSFAGSCSAGFTCKGDAATCALAQEVHKRNCELNATTAASGLYDAAKDATGNVTGGNPNNSTFTVGPGSFNATDAIGGAQCVQDLNITVWGSSITLPLSSICGPLGYIGNVLVMVSLLLAARIVTRG